MRPTGKGLVRITPAALDGSTETVVEKVPAELSGAQGLLWAFDNPTRLQWWWFSWPVPTHRLRR